MNRLLKDLDCIKASQETKEKTLNAILLNKKKKSQKPLVLGLVMVVCILFLLIPIQKQSSTAYISMDINPSFELEINEKYQVINIKTYNLDGDKIINKENLKDKKLSDVLKYLLTDKEYKQYLNNGILEVSIFSIDQTFSDELEKYMNTQLKQSQVKQYHCSQVNEKTYDNANQHHMSAGKFQIIEKILSYTTLYTQDELRTKSMKELYNLLEQLNPNDVPKSCQSQGHHKNGHK